MKRSKFTDEQIIGFIKSYEAGVSVTDLARQHGFSEMRAIRGQTTFRRATLST